MRPRKWLKQHNKILSSGNPRFSLVIIEIKNRLQVMENEKLKIYISFAEFIFGTIGLGLVSTNINYYIQNREVTIKEQASVGQFVQQALQEDVGVRRRFAQYFATVTRSDEMRKRWAEYATKVESEFDKLSQQKIALEEKAKKESNQSSKNQIFDNIEKINMELSPKPSTAKSENSARIYFHISSNNQVSKSENIANFLRENNFIVPKTSITSSIPKETQLRYFRISDKDEAESLISLVQSRGVKVTAKYLKGYELSTRPRLYELWFSKNE
jgi:hypothetical protein